MLYSSHFYLYDNRIAGSKTPTTLSYYTNRILRSQVKVFEISRYTNTVKLSGILSLECRITSCRERTTPVICCHCHGELKPHRNKEGANSTDLHSEFRKIRGDDWASRRLHAPATFGQIL